MYRPRFMIAVLFALLSVSGCATVATRDNGMVTLQSPHSAAETMRRLESEVRKRGLAVAARVDHAGAATKIGANLRYTEVLIFGHPKAGTPLMQCAQSIGIDLPLKALVWVDAQSRVWLAYNDPVWIVHRHGSAECAAAENVRKALSAIVAATLAP